MLADMSSAHRQRQCFVFFFYLPQKVCRKSPDQQSAMAFVGWGGSMVTVV